jgi:hypothetical protein
MNESLTAAWLALPDWQIFLSLIVGYLGNSPFKIVGATSGIIAEAFIPAHLDVVSSERARSQNGARSGH